MDDACVTSKGELPPPTGKGPTRPCVVIAHNGSVPHALFYDLTHDNESYLDKRSAEDALSTGALMTFSYSAIGSVKGFDDLYPKLLNLVHEKRKYEATRLTAGSGIARAKRILNSLHAEMAIGKFEEGHVHEENGVNAAFRSPLLMTDAPLVSGLASRAALHSERIPSRRPYRLPKRLQGQRFQ